jgi:hypothetical protein
VVVVGRPGCAVGNIRRVEHDVISVIPAAGTVFGLIPAPAYPDAVLSGKLQSFRNLQVAFGIERQPVVLQVTVPSVFQLVGRSGIPLPQV